MTYLGISCPGLCANTAVSPTKVYHPWNVDGSQDREEHHQHSCEPHTCVPSPGTWKAHKTQRRTPNPQYRVPTPPLPPIMPTHAPSCSPFPVEGVAREEEGAGLTLGCAGRLVPRADPRPTLAASVQAAGQVSQR